MALGSDIARIWITFVVLAMLFPPEVRERMTPQCRNGAELEASSSATFFPTFLPRRK